LIIFIFRAVFIAIVGLDFETTVGASIAVESNIGPGLRDVGPAHNHTGIPTIGKWFLSFLMLLGRRELLTPFF
jgi:trk system potassium uptake protein TrkH